MLNPCHISSRTDQLLRQLLATGGMSAGALECDDCRATYDDLSAKGVNFLREPADQFYGVDATIQDPFGKTFTLLEPKNR